MTDVSTAPPPSASNATFARCQESLEAQLSVLATYGKETRRYAKHLGREIESVGGGLRAKGDPGSALEMQALAKIVQTLAEKLSDWSDRCAAQALFIVAGCVRRGYPSLSYVARNVGTWMECHVEEPKKLGFCLEIQPPPGIKIEKFLGGGAEKQVFNARWPEVTPYEVAFKHFRKTDGRERGDAFPHPLRGHHPNIIETFVLRDKDHVYLVERLLQTTLDDEWEFRGVGEVVNLVRDLAHALGFVHGYNRIHGDIKLDNTGFEDGSYILLDFGLCRSEPTDSCAWTPTGNVRGLAPELLNGEANTARSDVWALGSVAYAALTGLPPFFERREKQHGFGKKRTAVIAEHAERAADPTWRTKLERDLVQFVPELALRQLLREMLDFEPQRRPGAQQVFERCNAELGQFLRPVPATLRSTPNDEFKSLSYLDEAGDLSLASKSQQLALKDATARVDLRRLGKVDCARLESVKATIDSL